MPPARKMQTSALLSSGPVWAATVLASFRLSSVLSAAEEPTAAQFNCFRKPRREMGLLIRLSLDCALGAGGRQIDCQADTAKQVVGRHLLEAVENDGAGPGRHFTRAEEQVHLVEELRQIIRLRQQLGIIWREGVVGEVGQAILGDIPKFVWESNRGVAVGDLEGWGDEPVLCQQTGRLIVWPVEVEHSGR